MRYEGSKYKIRSLKDTATLIREELKEKMPNCTWSVANPQGHRQLRFTLRSCDKEVRSDINRKWYNINYYHIEDCEELNDYGKEMFMKAREIINQYNMDDSDPMTDYFHVHFYEDYTVSDNFSVKTPKPLTKKDKKSDVFTTDFSNFDKDKVEIDIIKYSDKAIAVIGDTKPIKDILRSFGGRFNPRLTCGAGWVFSARKEKEIRQFFGA